MPAPNSSKFLFCLAATFTLSMHSISFAQEHSCGVGEAQAVLKGLGYDPGPLDGAWGRRTADAVRKYQASTELTDTGNLDAATCVGLSDERKNGAPLYDRLLQIEFIEKGYELDEDEIQIFRNEFVATAAENDYSPRKFAMEKFYVIWDKRIGFAGTGSEYWHPSTTHLIAVSLTKIGEEGTDDVGEKYSISILDKDVKYSFYDVRLVPTGEGWLHVHAVDPVVWGRGPGSVSMKVVGTLEGPSLDRPDSRSEVAEAYLWAKHQDAFKVDLRAAFVDRSPLQN